MKPVQIENMKWTFLVMTLMIFIFTAGIFAQEASSCEELTGKAVSNNPKIYYTVVPLSINSVTEIKEIGTVKTGSLINSLQSSTTNEVTHCYGQWTDVSGSTKTGYVALSDLQASESTVAFAQETKKFYPDSATLPTKERFSASYPSCHADYTGKHRCIRDQIIISLKTDYDYKVAICESGKWNGDVDTRPERTYLECINECQTDSDFSSSCEEPYLEVSINSKGEIGAYARAPLTQIESFIVTKNNIDIPPCIDALTTNCVERKEANMIVIRSSVQQSEEYNLKVVLKDKTTITGLITKPQGTSFEYTASCSNPLDPNSINGIVVDSIFTKTSGNRLCPTGSGIGYNDVVSACFSRKNQDDSNNVWCSKDQHGYCGTTKADCVSGFVVKPYISADYAAGSLIRDGDNVAFTLVMYDKAKTYYVNAAQFILINNDNSEKAINGICTPAQDGKSNCRFTIPLADVSAATNLKLRATGLSSLQV